MQAQSPPAMEFFQSLLKGSGMSSSFANWMAPTLDPDELERKIVDLRAVLQWLEANVRLTQATIQGLEVQRMTLSTLKTMNVDFGDLASQLGSAMRAGAEAMGTAAHMAEPAPPAGAQAPSAGGGAEAASEPAMPAADDAKGRVKDGGEAAPLGGIVDPMQWWSTLSEQFTKVASEALRDSAWPMPAAAAPAGESSKASSKASAKPASSASAGASSRSAPAAPATAGKAPAARKRPAAAAKTGAKAGAAKRKAPARPPR
ncbi:MAG: hypothetical protein KGJ03_05835 [Betaproteobacteria bacterium]|nr:hypothetical protein [Betaproteobacteria bacterium]